MKDILQVPAWTLALEIGLISYKNGDYLLNIFSPSLDFVLFLKDFLIIFVNVNIIFVMVKQKQTKNKNTKQNRNIRTISRIRLSRVKIGSHTYNSNNTNEWVYLVRLPWRWPQERCRLHGHRVAARCRPGCRASCGCNASSPAHSRASPARTLPYRAWLAHAGSQ